MKRMASIAAVLAIALASVPAGAWEAETTQAGLAEQAAFASRLEQRLQLLGFDAGLLEPLTIPPADAPSLIADIHLVSPSHGDVPDARGRQSALAWLAAGAVLADIPARYGANHFYDVFTHRGWQRPDRGLIAGLTDDVRQAMGRAALPAQGVPAPDWVTDRDNPFNLAGFLDQYAKAATAATPGERSRAMAGALVAAGAMLHVLGDLGNPARVRGDEAACLSPLGGGPDDLGSRFERIAALAFGRLGVPAASRTITRTHLRDYFTSPAGTGLADEIARSYFSPDTLPERTRIGDEVHPRLALPAPALPPRLNLMAASRGGGATLRAADGTCLARYRVDHDVLSFSTDDDCMLEQVSAILPEVASYEAGLLDFLLRGELGVTVGPQISVSAKGLGAGTLEILVEDDHGIRKSIYSGPVAAGAAELAHVAAPSTGIRIVAVFRGADAAGEPVVAVGAAKLSSR